MTLWIPNTWNGWQRNLKTERICIAQTEVTWACTTTKKPTWKGWLILLRKWINNRMTWFWNSIEAWNISATNSQIITLYNSISNYLIDSKLIREFAANFKLFKIRNLIHCYITNPNQTTSSTLLNSDWFRLIGCIYQV